MTHQDIDILARTLFGEAEANNVLDAEAIACVIMNRVNFAKWPDNIAAVCLQPWQFSCWNANDPNRERILNARGGWFRQCQAIAARAAAGELVDPTNGSTHYYATYVKAPRWAKGKKPVYSVKHYDGSQHLFFNNIDTTPPTSAKEALDQARPLSATKTVKTAQLTLGSASAIGAAAQLIDQYTPTIRDLQSFAPWVLVAILMAGIGYLVWVRINERNKGVR